jgi:hypothetical protein
MNINGDCRLSDTSTNHEESSIFFLLYIFPFDQFNSSIYHIIVHSGEVGFAFRI